MPTSATFIDEVAETESSKPAVNWGPIIAGALAASTLTFILMVLGSGLGLTLVSPWSAQGIGATTFAVSTAVWLVVVQWLSALVGGYLAGRLRTKWVGVHTDEVFFRDTAHGFLAWALATLIFAGILGSALSAVLGTSVRAASTAASAVASSAAAGAAANAPSDTANGVAAYLVDTLFRPADAARLAGPEGEAAAVAQASRILIVSAAGPISEPDRAYLAQLVAARTGLSEADARTRVAEFIDRVEAAKVQAKETADSARKAGATFALVGALSLAIGAFIASAAAAFGGAQRDENEARYVAVRRD